MLYTTDMLERLVETLRAAQSLTRTGDHGIGTGVDAISPHMEEIGAAINKAIRLANKTIILQGVPVRKGQTVEVWMTSAKNDVCIHCGTPHYAWGVRATGEDVCTGCHKSPHR